MGKGRVATVLGVEDDGNVKVDVGGDDSLIADSFADGGDDSPPLPGDVAALNDGPETGTQQITGFDDDTASGASGGEKRTYARNSNGVPVVEFHMKGDGTVVIKGLPGLLLPQSFLRSEDFYVYLDAVILAMSTAIGAIPGGGPAKTAFDTAITAANTTLRPASVSTVIKGE